MNLSFYIAKRYLLSKKSHNAINIVSSISAGGVLVGTFALVCVLSVFNGFGGIIENLFSDFDPDLKISIVEGKSFSVNEKEIKALRQLPEIISFSEILQENAMLRHKEKQFTGTIKGVDSSYISMIDENHVIISGKYELKDKAFNYGVLGQGLASTLGVAPYFNEPVFIYAPRKTGRINLSNPKASFSMDRVFVSALFSVQQPDYDMNMMIIPIELARDLYQYDTEQVTSIELKIDSTKDINSVKTKITTILGKKYKVHDRYEQQEDYFRIMKIEKWITYLILSFILLIAIFNIIGSLSMLIIDKKEDIKTLRNMGANQRLIRRIFLFEGWLISMFGAIIGIILGSIVCIVQEHFGFITLPDGANYVINAYPVKLELTDILLVFLTVSIMGYIAAYYPVKQIKTESAE